MSFPAYYPDAPPPRYVSTLVEPFEYSATRLVDIFPRPKLQGEPLELQASGEPAENLQTELREDRLLTDLAQSILDLRNDAEEDAPPTDFAVTQALKLTSFATSLLAQKWRAPRLATDGYGGLRLSWRSGSSEIRAVIGNSEDTERYLYWEDPGGYGSISNFTAATLFSYLDSLIQKRPLSTASRMP